MLLVQSTPPHSRSGSRKPLSLLKPHSTREVFKGLRWMRAPGLAACLMSALSTRSTPAHRTGLIGSRIPSALDVCKGSYDSASTLEHALGLPRDKRLQKWNFMCKRPTAAQLRQVRVLVVGVGQMAIGAAHERHIPHKVALAQAHTHRCPCPCTDARTRAQTHTNRRTRTRAATHVHAQMHMRTHRCP